VFNTDLDETDVAILLDRYCSKTQRSSLKPVVTLAATIRKRRSGILAAVRLCINNTHHEGLNRRVHLIINQAYGFHSTRATPALNMITPDPSTTSSHTNKNLIPKTTHIHTVSP